MKKIRINPSPNADTRTAGKIPSKADLLKATLQHIGDVRQALGFFADMLKDATLRHDNTKISGMDEFYSDVAKGLKGPEFKAGEWYRRHVSEERHHLSERCPQDVSLIDVLEMAADVTMAGMGRNGGKVYEPEIDSEILRRAYANTIELLMANVEVMDEANDGRE